MAEEKGFAVSKTCFLFGHADCPDSIMPKLEQALEACCSNYGITDFYVGNRGAFDRMAAAAVMRMKKSKDIKLYLLHVFKFGLSVCWILIVGNAVLSVPALKCFDYITI